MKRITILCAVCKKPVDRIESWRNPDLRTYTVIAYCHGEREETKLKDEDLLDTHNISGGTAFAREQVTHGKD